MLTWKYEPFWSLIGYAPRPEQKKIINEIISAIDMGFRNIIIEAGTGTGKSAIATTIANWMGDSYILTMTKQLQNQYLDDFDYMLTEIKGKSNYTCRINPETTCDDCIRAEYNENKCYNCPYTHALRTAQDADCVITNYDYLFYAGNYAGQFLPRDLLILDETHNLEKKIMSLIGKTLNRNTVYKRYGIDIFAPILQGSTLKSIDNNKYWIDLLYELEHRARNKRSNSVSAKKREAFDKDAKKYAYLITMLANTESKFIIELPNKKEILNDKEIRGQFKNGLKAEFKPLTIKNYSNQLLQFGDTRLFLTGTLGNKEKFCQWIGIDPNETYYLYVKSPFPVENRPIIKDYIGSMSGGRWHKTQSLDKIQEIIRKHHGQKGVIHTASNQQAWFIKKGLASKDVWVAQGSTREETIRRFESTNKQVVLVGAGIKDGVDFKGDKCRYQIIFKIPYPSLAGKQVNIRTHYDESWYNYQTIMPLMQAYGRGIRDMDDYCTCYVLDNDFEKLLRKFNYLFNEYFLEAIQGRNEAVKPKRIPKPIPVKGGK